MSRKNKRPQAQQPPATHPTVATAPTAVELLSPGAVATAAQSAPQETAIDPVCGMTVEVARAAAACTYADKTYYFCNPRCLEKFCHEPGHFVPSTLPVVNGVATSDPPPDSSTDEET